MGKYLTQVIVLPKQEVSDPKGLAIQSVLNRLSNEEPEEYPGKIGELKAGKFFRFFIESNSILSADEMAKTISDKVLANPNIESFYYSFKKLSIKDRIVLFLNKRKNK